MIRGCLIYITSGYTVSTLLETQRSPQKPLSLSEQMGRAYHLKGMSNKLKVDTEG